MPAIRRWKNCWTDSPGRRVSMPETAFCRQSSWSMAEPASKPSSSSPSAAGPSPASEPESESESEHPSMARLGPDSCLSSVTRKEKSLAPFLPSARGAPAAGAPGVPDPRDAAKGAEAVGTCSTATPAAAPTPAAAAPLDRAACNAETAGLAMSPIVPSPALRLGMAPGNAPRPGRAPLLIAPCARAMAAATASLSNAGSRSAFRSRRGGERERRGGERERREERRSSYRSSYRCRSSYGRSSWRRSRRSSWRR
mmetsp:Transcript_33539/g.108464  ORF Transcript_33539/g.108464 Transcript_33539/m.108464 type:complete len:254 (+) Transcript_33539:263-1024(+)